MLLCILRSTRLFVWRRLSTRHRHRGPAGAVSAGMNRFVGLGALTVPNESFDQVVASCLRIVRQFYDDEPLRRYCSEHLDNLVRSKKSLFCPRRAANDINALLDASTDGGLAKAADLSEFVTCPPEKQLLFTDQDGTLR